MHCRFDVRKSFDTSSSYFEYLKTLESCRLELSKSLDLEDGIRRRVKMNRKDILAFCSRHGSRNKIPEKVKDMTFYFFEDEYWYLLDIYDMGTDISDSTLKSFSYKNKLMFIHPPSKVHVMYGHNPIVYKVKVIPNLTCEDLFRYLF